MLDTLNIAALQVIGAVPNPGRGEPPPGFDKFVTLLKWAAAISLGTCVLGFLDLRRHDRACSTGPAAASATTAARVGAVMAACILIGSASAIVTALT